LTRISREIRHWALHHRSDKSLSALAAMYNPCIRGWINYYSHFYPTQLRPALKRIDAYVIRWALLQSAIFLDHLFRVPGIRLTQMPTMTSNPLVESYELRGAIVECNKLLRSDFGRTSS
jgi:hypothetical protein